MTRHKKIIKSIAVCTIVLSQLTSSGLVIAETISNSESMVEAESSQISEKNTTISSTTNSSTSLDTSEVKKVEIEKSYDERKMGLDKDPDSIHPTVLINKKKLTDRLLLEGELIAGEEENKETYLEKLILQAKVENQEWYDVKEFEHNQEQSLQKRKIDFSFDEVLPTDITEYRIVAIYDIEISEADKVIEKNQHKAHVLIKDFEEETIESTISSEEVTQASSTESSTSQTNTVDSSKDEESDTNISTNTTDSSSQEYETSSSETSTEESVEDTPSTEAEKNKSEMPTSSSGLLRDSDNLLTEEQNKLSRNSRLFATPFDTNYGEAIHKQQEGDQLTSVSYEDNYPVGPKFYRSTKEGQGQCEQTISYEKTSAEINAWALDGADKELYLAYDTDPNNFFGLNTKQDLNSFKGAKKLATSTNIWSDYKGKEVSLSSLSPGTRYYYAIYEKQDNGSFKLSSGYNPNGSWAPKLLLGKVYYLTSFITKPATALKVTATTFSDVKATSVLLRQSSYTGDATDDHAKLDFWNGTSTSGTALTTPKPNITKGNGKYPKDGAVRIPGLSPGTKYYGKVRILKLGGIADNDSDWVYASNGEAFITPIAPKKPDNATNITSSSANFIAQYQAASGTTLGSHPISSSNWEIQISKDGGTFDRVTATAISSGDNEGAKLEDWYIDKNSSPPKISFKISGLSSKTKYKIKYRLKSKAGIGAGIDTWSEYSQESEEFTTLAEPLTVKKPVFKQNTATVSGTANSPIVSIGLNSALSKYEGDINAADGKIFVKAPSTTWTVKNSSIKHTTTTNGTYGKNGTTDQTISGLWPGTKYTAKASFKDDSGTEIESDESDQFSTPVYSTSPSIGEKNRPTTYGNATVALNLGFLASGTISGDHPIVTESNTDFTYEGIELKIRLKSNTTYWNVHRSDSTSSTHALFESTPQLVGLNTADKSVKVKLKNLRANETYVIQYRLKNNSGQWSNRTEEVEFTTNKISLNLPSPTFDLNSFNTTETTSSVKMNQGDFTGHTDSGIHEQDRVRVRKKIGVNSWGAWTDKVTSLPHTDTSTFIGPSHNPPRGKYGQEDGTLIEDLEPGSIYNTQIVMKSEQEGAVNYYQHWGNVGELFTPVFAKRVESVPESSLRTDGASLQAFYSATAGDNVGAHPRNFDDYDIQVRKEGSSQWESFTRWEPNFINTPEPTGPYVTSVRTNRDANPAPNIEFELKGLDYNTKYYVKYRLRNRSEVWSNYSEEQDFTTLNLEPGLRLTEVPSNFNFGTTQVSEILTEKGLHETDQSSRPELNVGIENVATSQGWNLSARLSQMTNEFSGENLQNAQIVFSKRLQKTANGNLWSDITDTNNFEGLDGLRVTLNAGAGETTSILRTNSNDSSIKEGVFRGKLDFESVKLVLPPGHNARKGYEYNGEITWTLDSIP